MSWRISQKVEDILAKAIDFEPLKKEDILHLLSLPLYGKEIYALLQAANAMSHDQFNDKGENHFHIGLNVAPCPVNCKFCSLAEKTGAFTDSLDFSLKQVINWAKGAEAQGADALNLMTTGNYSFKRLLKIGSILKQSVSTPLVANTRDITHKEAEALLEAGFVGAYHALRLAEGRDTPLSPQKRINTIKVLNDVGLRWMNCIEPVGPEHGHEEIAELMLLARQYKATYSGVMRRINFPGSPMECYGMITELEMARLVAVSRLVMGNQPRAHCTHEPNKLALVAGANLFFPEVGSSPRDCNADTEKGRGYGTDKCRKMHMETGWNPDLPSNCFENNVAKRLVSVTLS